MFFILLEDASLVILLGPTKVTVGTAILQKKKSCISCSFHCPTIDSTKKLFCKWDRLWATSQTANSTPLSKCSAYVRRCPLISTTSFLVSPNRNAVVSAVSQALNRTLQQTCATVKDILHVIQTMRRDSWVTTIVSEIQACRPLKNGKTLASWIAVARG